MTEFGKTEVQRFSKLPKLKVEEFSRQKAAWRAP